MINSKQQFSLKLKGEYVITKAKIETPRQWELHQSIKEKQESGVNCIEMIRELNSICRVEKEYVKNLIPTVGRTLLAQALSSATALDLQINYGALGIDNTTPSNSDTALGTESYRKQVSSISYLSNVTYVTTFYSADEVTGTFYEQGLFINATDTASSGTLISRVLLNSGSGTTKSSTESLTIDYTFTIT